MHSSRKLSRGYCDPRPLTLAPGEQGRRGDGNALSADGWTVAPRYEVSVVEKADDEVSDYCEMQEYVKTCGHAGGRGSEEDRGPPLAGRRGCGVWSEGTNKTS